MIRKVLMAAGFCLVVGPLGMMAWHRYEAGQVIASYEGDTAQAEEDLLDEAREYNQSLKSGLPAASYESTLGGREVMGILEIPRIGLKLPIYHGTGEAALSKGAGHMEGTALPAGQPGDRPVIAGHRGLPGNELFTRLDELESGDLFTVTVAGHPLTYEVTEIETVAPDDQQAIAARSGEDLVTLLTCTPYGINTHRLLVTGKRTDKEGGSPDHTKPVIMTITAAVGLLYLYRRKKK